MNTTEKIVLLQSIIGVLTSAGPTPVRDLAARFNVDEATVRELVSLLGMSGVPGETGAYQHGDLFDIDWDALLDDDEAHLIETVVVRSAPRFSPREIAALLAGIQYLSALNVPDPNVVPNLVAKLTATAVTSPPAVQLNPQPVPALFERFRAIIQAKQSVTFDYADADGNTSSRHVQPIRVSSSDDIWYLRAWCSTREAVRVFRLDRISSLTPSESLGEAVEQIVSTEQQQPELAPNYEPSATDLDLQLKLSNGADHALRRFGAAVSKDKASASVRVPVASRAINVVTAALGDIEVVGPNLAREQVYEWAQRALAQYGS